MSFKHQHIVIAHSRAQDGVYNTLLQLANSIDERKGYSDITLEQLADLTRTSRSAVQERVKKLMELGEINREDAKMHGKPRRHYRLTLTCPPDAPCSKDGKGDMRHVRDGKPLDATESVASGLVTALPSARKMLPSPATPSGHERPSSDLNLAPGGDFIPERLGTYDGLQDDRFGPGECEPWGDPGAYCQPGCAHDTRRDSGQHADVFPYRNPVPSLPESGSDRTGIRYGALPESGTSSTYEIQKNSVAAAKNGDGTSPSNVSTETDAHATNNEAQADNSTGTAWPPVRQTPDTNTGQHPDPIEELTREMYERTADLLPAGSDYPMGYLHDYEHDEWN